MGFSPKRATGSGDAESATWEVSRILRERLFWAVRASFEFRGSAQFEPSGRIRAKRESKKKFRQGGGFFAQENRGEVLRIQGISKIQVLRTKFCAREFFRSQDFRAGRFPDFKFCAGKFCAGRIFREGDFQIFSFAPASFFAPRIFGRGSFQDFQISSFQVLRFQDFLRRDFLRFPDFRAQSLGDFWDFEARFFQIFRAGAVFGRALSQNSGSGDFFGGLGLEFLIERRRNSAGRGSITEPIIRKAGHLDPAGRGGDF